MLIQEVFPVENTIMRYCIALNAKRFAFSAIVFSGTKKNYFKKEMKNFEVEKKKYSKLRIFLIQN